MNSTETDSLCLQAQFEEIEALQSIYGDAWKTDEFTPGCFAIDITEKDKTVSLYVTLPENYPLHSPPTYTLSAPLLNLNQKNRLRFLLEEEYLANIGQSVLYQWIEKIRDFLLDLAEAEEKASVPLLEIAENVEDDIPDEIPEIIHGEIISDRKSTFQPHLAKVYSVRQVNQVVAALKSNKKIANATHNMYAYRISIGNSAFSQDCDDDGETQAGGRMLHLMQILDVKDVLVVVSRWYGGVQLGPDRFRHINNATRQIIQQAGLLPTNQKKS